MRKLLSLASAAGLMIAALPLTAEAFPVTASPATADASVIALVAGGCGVAAHRGPMGGCRANRTAVVVVRRPRCHLVGPLKVC